MTNIIFDTNAARDFVEGIGLEELEQYAEHTAERFDEKELRLFVSPIVIQELLYHLVDHTDRDFSVSFKAVKAITGLGLVDAKKLVDSVPAEIKKDVPADEADNIRKQLVEAGATVEYK